MFMDVFEFTYILICGIRVYADDHECIADEYECMLTNTSVYADEHEYMQTNTSVYADEHEYMLTNTSVC